MNDMVQIALLVLMIIGIVLVVAAMVMTARSGEGDADNGINGGNIMAAVEKAVADTDKVTEDLHKEAERVFRELDEKYQELLFLYSLIDEKKTEAAKLFEGGRKPAKRRPAGSAPPEEGEPVQQHPRYQEITEMIAGGLTISEAAKKLDMGQGEVKLIVELGKGRRGS
jgi:DNA-directed RNA polymerase specialized sigma24 family protein